MPDAPRRFSLIGSSTALALAMTMTMLVHAGGPPRWQLLKSSAPPARYWHAMCTDTDRNRVVLFGGFKGGALNDTWEWDGAHWRRMTPAGARPPARYMHALAYDQRRHVTILFGGLDADDHALQDTWSWDGVRWRLLSDDGPELYGHAMAYDSARRRIVLFGGYQEGHELHETDETADDTWLWNGAEWNRVSSDGPAGRWKHAMAYDADRERVVLVGGEDVHFENPHDMGPDQKIERTLDDCWEWDGERWTERSDDQIQPVRGHALAWDPDLHMIIMFGGSNDNQIFRLTRNASVPALPVIENHGPGPRWGVAMAFDPITHRVLMFGGRDNATMSKETWGFGQ